MTGSLAWAPVVLFAVIFLWTPPHFWALAIRYADDYRAADVPMLPAVATVEVTSRKMLALHRSRCGSLSLVLVPVGHLGLIYGLTALVLGAAFISGCLALPARTRRPAWRCGVFSFSITYVTLLFAAIAVDTLVRYGLVDGPMAGFPDPDRGHG